MSALPLSGPTPSSASYPQHPPPTLGGHSKTPSQIYVLSADGSRLFLLDPTEPPGELPPAYHTIQSPRSVHASAASLPPTSPRYSYSHLAEIGVEDEPNGGPSSPRSVRVQALPSVRSWSSASLGSQRDREDAGGRQRAYTTCEDGVVRGRGALQDGRIAQGGSAQMGMANSGIEPDVDADERTALLGGIPGSGRRSRGTLRSIFCGELEDGDVDMTWKAGWRRFWTPVGRKEYWRTLLHLFVLNFPFVSSPVPFPAQEKARMRTKLIKAGPLDLAIPLRRHRSWYRPTHHPSDRRCCMVVDPDTREDSSESRSKCHLL